MTLRVEAAEASGEATASRGHAQPGQTGRDAREADSGLRAGLLLGGNFDLRVKMRLLAGLGPTSLSLSLSPAKDGQVAPACTGKGSLPHRPGHARALGAELWALEASLPDKSPLCLADSFLPPCSLLVSIGCPSPRP